MARDKVKTGESKDRQYRLAELVKASGVSRDMIKYYLRANLLPKPKKPRPNLALYTDNHLLLIRLILRFQQQTTLSLPAIAEVFQQANHDPNTIELELLSDRYHTGYRDNIIPFDTNTEGSTSLTFPETFIKELVEYGLLPEKVALDENEETIAGLLWSARNQGVPIEFFQAAQKKLHALADLEVKTLVAIRQPELDYDAAVASVLTIDRVINRWMISEKTSQARGLFQRLIENSQNALSTIHDTIYLPSRVFRQRFSVDAQFTNLTSKLDEDPKNLGLIHQLCRAALLLTDTQRAIMFADAALALEPEDELAISCKSLAYGMENNLEKAVEYADRLTASGIRNPLALEARLLALLMQAARLGGVSDTSGLLKQAVELFLEPPVVRPTDPIDQFEAWLLLGRASTLFPDAINREEEAIKALRTMLQSLGDKAYTELDFPMEAIHVIYLVYANYYLGLLFEMLGEHSQAAAHFEKVIQLDPSSNFGETAYLKLAK